MSTKTGRFTKTENLFIEKNHKAMSVREMADKLGRSHSGVHKRIQALELSESELVQCPRTPLDKRGRQGDTMRRLVELRDILYDALLESGANSKPRIASEYRAVLREIQELKAIEAGEKGSALDELFKEFDNADR